MSSLRSSAPVDRRETTIVDACVRVAEVSFYAYAEPCDATRLAELDAALHAQSDGRPDWLRVFVQFSGDCHGHLTLHVPSHAAEELVASFVGLADAPLAEAEIADGLGEFANMVCGAFLTDAGNLLDFSLTRPAVVHEPAGWSPLAALAATDGEGTAYALAINDWPMILRVDLEVRL
jgi:hypothetical protein